MHVKVAIVGVCLVACEGRFKFEHRAFLVHVFLCWTHVDRGTLCRAACHVNPCGSRQGVVASRQLSMFSAKRLFASSDEQTYPLSPPSLAAAWVLLRMVHLVDRLPQHPQQS